MFVCQAGLLAQLGGDVVDVLHFLHLQWNAIDLLGVEIEFAEIDLVHMVVVLGIEMHHAVFEIEVRGPVGRTAQGRIVHFSSTFCGQSRRQVGKG